MRKILSVLCVVLLAFLFVACSPNPGIKAGKAFLDNPTIENFKKYTAEVAYLEDEEMEILAIMMVREHLSPQLHSTLLTQQIFSGKEQNYYSQAAHMKELLDMDNRLKLEAQKLMRDYTYANDLRGYFES